MVDLRLDVACAVVDDSGSLLLTPHTELSGWALPEGPLDGGEFLRDGAARQVAEDTGLIVHVDRPVGLYYWAGLRRMTTLFAGWPLGGELVQRSRRPTAVRYFAPDALPSISRAIMALDALAGTRHKPRTIAEARKRSQAPDSASPWRLITSWLRLRREARRPIFDVRAVALVWDDGHRRVLTVPGEHSPTVPRVRCHGETPPWEQLADSVAASAGFRPSFRWVGAWQDVSRGAVEYVFAATVREAAARGRARWATARNSPLADRDADYVARVKPTYARDPVWLIERERSVAAGDTVLLSKEDNHHDPRGTDRGRAR